VLNIGAKAPRAKSAPTSITRAAGMALTKVLAGEGAPYNVLVNALLVGFIEADQHVQAAARAGIPLADYVAAPGKDIPLGRIGRAEVREPCVLPCVGFRILHHRHRDQRRRRALANRVRARPTGRVSPRQWIGPDLEFHDLAGLSLAALDVIGRAPRVGRPDSASLPAGVRIIDAAV